MGIADIVLLIAFILLVIGAVYLITRAWQVWCSEQKANITRQILDVISVLRSSLLNDLTLSRDEMQKLYKELMDVYLAIAGYPAAETQNPQSNTIPTGGYEFEQVDSDKQTQENCTLLCVTDEDIFSKYETLSDAEMVTPKELTIKPEQFLYGVISAPANISLIIRTENDYGQHHEWRITPSDDSAVRRHPFRVMYPHDGGWKTGSYLMQFSLLDESGETLDRISVGITVE